MADSTTGERLAYRVEENACGCRHCGSGHTYDVIGPDDVALAVSYTDQERAEYMAEMLSRAYAQGCESVDAAEHDRRVTELLAANNREVERRRQAEAARERIAVENGRLREERDRLAAENARLEAEAQDLGDKADAAQCRHAQLREFRDAIVNGDEAKERRIHALLDDMSRLEAENARLRDALRPFVEMLDAVEKERRAPFLDGEWLSVQFHAYRAARDALRKPQDARESGEGILPPENG